VIRCYITDRCSLRGETLLDAIARNLKEGADWIQIREKDLSARDLFELVGAAVALPNPRGVKILVNTRADVAVAAGADGVHLPAGSPAARRFRSLAYPARDPLVAQSEDYPAAGPGGPARTRGSALLIGVSCHSVEEVVAAEASGADYAFFGPVFAPLSKGTDLSPHGREGLRQAAAGRRIPILALGGITSNNMAECVDAGAAGSAGISLFQSPNSDRDLLESQP